MKKGIIISVIFYILILLQVSFAPHFRFFGLVPNLILISVILFNLLEKPENKFGLMAAFLGGFLMDVYSSHIFGIYAAAYLAIAVFIKYFLRQYVKLPSWI